MMPGAVAPALRNILNDSKLRNILPNDATAGDAITGGGLTMPLSVAVLSSLVAEGALSVAVLASLVAEGLPLNDTDDTTVGASAGAEW